MRLLKHADPNGGDIVGFDGVEYDAVGRDSLGCPIFLVPDSVYESHIGFGHFSAVDEELDKDASAALKALQAKDKSVRIAKGETDVPETKTEAKARAKIEAEAPSEDKPKRKSRRAKKSRPATASEEKLATATAKAE